MKGYTSGDVARLLGVTVAQVRSFARDGFLTPGRGPRGELRFSFQDLVILRTAKALVAARIPARRIRRALRRLRHELPQGRSLAEVRIAAEGDRIVVRDGGAAWNPESGQLHLDFAVSGLAVRAAPIARRTAQAARRGERELDARDWYALGLELEAVDPEEARDAYRRRPRESGPPAARAGARGGGGAALPRRARRQSRPCDGGVRPGDRARGSRPPGGSH